MYQDQFMKGVGNMTMMQDQAIQMISLLPDDRVAVLIEVMKGFMKPIENLEKNVKDVRIGVAKGKFTVPDNIDECNEKIAEMFGVDE